MINIILQRKHSNDYEKFSEILKKIDNKNYKFIIINFLLSKVKDIKKEDEKVR